MKLRRRNRAHQAEVQIPDWVLDQHQVLSGLPYTYTYLDRSGPSFQIELDDCAGCRKPLISGNVAWISWDTEARLPLAWHPVCGRKALG